MLCFLQNVNCTFIYIYVSRKFRFLPGVESSRVESLLDQKPFSYTYIPICTHTYNLLLSTNY